MEKLFHFDAPRDKYQCDAAVVWCFDNRFEAGFRKFLKKVGVYNSDPIKIAGGAKCLASAGPESDFRPGADPEIHPTARRESRHSDAAFGLRGVRRVGRRVRRRYGFGTRIICRHMERARENLKAFGQFSRNVRAVCLCPHNGPAAPS
jgi:hypothetical protein